jgi:hypothetical protein
MQKPILIALLLATATLAAKAEDFAFKPAEQGYYAFDTGQFRGKLRTDGQSQGICSLVHVPTGMEMAAPPGLLSYYRVFSKGVRYGNAARDWPVVARVVDGGALEIRFPPAKEHPMEIAGKFRWRSADTLDLETTVKAAGALPSFEVFLSSYFVEGFDASVYVKRNIYGTGQPAAMLRADWSELLDGNYLTFPRDAATLPILYDGRWDFSPNPVTWAFARYLAAPIAVRRHSPSGLTVVLMSPPEDCFAVGTPYNKRPPDGVAGHRSLYLSFFGRDLAAGQTTQARCRMILAKDLSDDAILERYKQYVAEQPRKTEFIPLKRIEIRSTN